MKKKFGIALMLMAICLTTIPVQAQSDIPHADLQVRSVSVRQIGERLYTRVTIYNYWDDEADKTRVFILLPIGVKVLSISAGCTASPPYFDGTQGLVICNLGDIGVDVTKTISITTDLPRYGHPKTFAAFAVSLRPDPIHSNNYGEATAP